MRKNIHKCLTFNRFLFIPFFIWFLFMALKCLKIHFKGWTRIFLKILHFACKCWVQKWRYLRIYMELCEIFNFFVERNSCQIFLDWPHRHIGRLSFRNRLFLEKIKMCFFVFFSKSNSCRNCRFLRFCRLIGRYGRSQKILLTFLSTKKFKISHNSK